MDTCDIPLMASDDNDDLKEFRHIAILCTDLNDLREIIEDCSRDRSRIIRTKVKKIYEDRLAELTGKQAEIDYYEKQFGIAE